MSPPLPQVDAAGRLRHLVTLDGLPRSLLEDLLVRAEALAAKPARNEALRGVTVANLFGEPSTRTRASFELAALRQGADVINLDNTLSSRAKGETLLDTAFTLLAMRVDIFVIRDAEPGVQEQMARAVDGQASVVSAGEANVSHPTQGLLDALTIRQCKGDFGGLSVALVGDIARSRVARSAHRALATLGVPDIRIVAPRAMMPDAAEFEGSRRIQSLDEGIAGADVVMMLRIQHERAGGGPVDIEAYHREFGLTAARLAHSAPKAIVMHPGPMNRGVEIDPDVADGPQSMIRRQVANGVAVRMAVLERLAAPRCAAAATPGSFIHVTCGPDLPMRRPLSIMRTNRTEGWVEVLYKVVGHGLAELALRRPGESLSCLGPIGRGFTADPARPRRLLVGGGVGIPPMVFFAESLASARGAKPLVLMGSELPFPFDLTESQLPAPGLPKAATAAMPLLETLGVPSRLASLSGFAGCHCGYVTELADAWLGSLGADERREAEIYSCGPHGMLVAVAALARRHGVRCQVSLEENMACGVGGCAGCTVLVQTPDGPAMKRVCVDGPVFDAATVFNP